MKKEREEEQGRSTAPASGSSVNLDDYAGDSEDNQLASDQSSRYIDDLHRGDGAKNESPDGQDEPLKK